MQYPLVLSSHRRIVIAPQGWFDGIGRLDPEGSALEIGINHVGEGGLAWFLDAQGLFSVLTWQGRVRRSLAQWAGFARQRERYRVAAPRQITAAELLDRIADHGEKSEEAPHTADLRSSLHAVPSGTALGAAFVAGYLGTRVQGPA